VPAAGAFAAVAAVENFSGGPAYAVGTYGNEIATLTVPGLFLSGVALALMFCLGLAVLAAGLKRWRRMHEAPASASATRVAGEPEGRRRQPSRSGHRRRGRYLLGY
ncbi:hypothetical protein, partial [Streptomyces antibioticus]|uniref:hypothetical protein n=1 Tax=Streptomyces antibioticus TaxID=1890 RepID=UPI0033B83B37